jgi:hypothetical protein
MGRNSRPSWPHHQHQQPEVGNNTEQKKLLSRKTSKNFLPKAQLKSELFTNLGARN